MSSAILQRLLLFFVQIPTEQTSQLGAKASYMKKLLNIVKEKTENESSDITMRFTLSALWNLTGNIIEIQNTAFQVEFIYCNFRCSIANRV